MKYLKVLVSGLIFLVIFNVSFVFAFEIYDHDAFRKEINYHSYNYWVEGNPEYAYRIPLNIWDITFRGKFPPARIVWNYFQYLSKIGFLKEVHGGSGLSRNKVPNDRNIYLTNDTLSKIFKDVASDYTGEYYTLERIVAEANKELVENGYSVEDLKKIRGYKSKVGKDLTKAYLNKAFVLTNIFGGVKKLLNITKEEYKNVAGNVVYPITSDITDYDPAPANWENIERDYTVDEFIKSIIIKSLISGSSPNQITQSFVNAAKDISQLSAMKKYLGGEINGNNPEHLKQLVYFGKIKALLENYSPKELVSGGYGRLLAEVEALNGSWLVKTDQEGKIISQKEISPKLINKYINMRLRTCREIMNKLNETNYYDEKLSISDYYDVKLVNSWVSVIFDKLGKKNYDPVDQTYLNNLTLEQAKNSIYTFIDLAKDLKPKLEKGGYGNLPIASVGADGNHARNLLNLYSNIALTLMEEGEIESKDKAVELVSQLTLANEKGRRLLSKLQEVYKASGVGKTDNYFVAPLNIGDVGVAKENKEIAESIAEEIEGYSATEEGNKDGRMAYAGVASMGASMIDYANYYFDQKKDVSFSDIYGKKENGEFKEGELNKMLDLGIEMELAGKIKEYLGIRADSKLDLRKGYISGIYTFWNQVLYAAVNNLGKEKGKEFVWKQLKARRDIREALQKKGVYHKGNPTSDDVSILQSFTKTLDAKIKGENLLQASKKEILNKIKTGDFSTQDEVKKALTEGYLDDLSKPQEVLYPRSRKEAQNWSWNELYYSSEHKTAYKELTVEKSSESVGKAESTENAAGKNYDNFPQDNYGFSILPPEDNFESSETNNLLF